jgi:hypothetical protein
MGMRARAVATIAVNDTIISVEACCRSACFGIEHESYWIPLYTVGNGVKAKKGGRLLLQLNLKTRLCFTQQPNASGL